MKLQQLRYITEVAKNNLNISATAQKLYTSQPGVSKQIKLLEEELGIQIFVRSGKHLTRMTPAGKKVIALANEALNLTKNIKKIAEDFNNDTSGTLTLATTHTQARYVLPPVIQQFMQAYPDVSLNIKQGTPDQIAKMVVEGKADLAIATEALDGTPDLINFPCYQWNHGVLLPKKHPLAKLNKITLKQLANVPLVSYSQKFTGRTKLDETFAQANLEPKYIFTAADSDVIKTYVRLGMGIGLIASMAKDDLEQELLFVPADHLFVPNITLLGIRKGSFIRAYVYDFIEKLASHLTKEVIDRGMQANAQEFAKLFGELELPQR